MNKQITEIFSCRLNEVLTENGITPEALLTAVEDEIEQDTPLKLRTIKGYLSSAASAKRNATIQTLQSIVRGLNKLVVVYKLLLRGIH